MIVFDDGQSPSLTQNEWPGNRHHGVKRMRRDYRGYNGDLHDDDDTAANEDYTDAYEANADDDSVYTGKKDPSRFLARLLSFLETPPHLRRTLFPLHPDLRGAGALPSLAMPHHLKADEWCPYREGVVLEQMAEKHVYQGRSENVTTKSGDRDQTYDKGIKTTQNRRKSPKSKMSVPDQDKSSSAPTLVNVGLPTPLAIHVDNPLSPATRLTVHLSHPNPPKSAIPPNFSTANITATPVTPATPRDMSGYYWGYTVRQASSLSAIFTECPYAGGYDLSIGTSERGKPLRSIGREVLPETFAHLLLVFGGVAGLEVALRRDKELDGVAEVSELFDLWVNLVPGQGSRTIRTEEAVWLGLMGVKDWLHV